MKAPLPLARLASLALRLCAIALVVVSPWLAPRMRPSHGRAVVYVIDRSDSVGAEGLEAADTLVAAAFARAGGARLGVVAVDGVAELLTPVGGRRAGPTPRGQHGGASDLAAGIRLARAALPAEGHRAIVVVTDGRPTRGDALAEVRASADLGIRVDVLPVTGPRPDLPLVTAFRPRATHAAEHQPVAFDVEVRADEPFRLEWTRDGMALQAHPHFVRRARRADADADGDEPPAVETVTIPLVDADPPPGPHVYAVKAVSWTHRFRHGGAPPPEPAHEAAPLLAAVSVEGRARAVVFSSSGGIPPVLKEIFTAAGLEAQALPMEQAGEPSSWSGADLVVLADARLAANATDTSGLSRAGQEALVDWVKEGGGLLVTGGSFGLAPEWSGSPLAKALPVEIEDRGHVEDPPVSLCVMLDRSGSMGAEVGNHTKLELALEASLAAADVLRPTDSIAIASVDTESAWDVPLGPVARMSELRDEVRKVQVGGGGIYVYTALADAYRALAKAKTPVRHVILFSDTSDSEEQSCESSACQGKSAESLAREAHAHGITTTVVGIGAEDASDTPFLRSLASAAGGRFYLTSEGADLRRIFLSETRVLAQDNLRMTRTTASAAGPHPVLEGLDLAKLPAVDAFVETRRRAGAESALVLDGTAANAGSGPPERRPLLATWRYGLGRVGTLATDLEVGLGEGWSSAPAAAQLLRQTLRFVVRQSDAHKADATVAVHGNVVDVAVELPPELADGQARDHAPATLELFAVAKSGASRKIPAALEPAGPGRYTARVHTGGEGVVVARVRDRRSGLVAEAVGREDQVVESTGEGPDPAYLDELARAGDGRVGPSPDETLALTARPGRELVATWPYALVAAAALVVLDLLVRRLGTRRAARPLALRTA